MYDVYLTLVLSCFCVVAGYYWYRVEAPVGLPPFLPFMTAYYALFHGLLSVIASRATPHLSYDRHLSGEGAIYVASFVVVQIAGYIVGTRLVPWRARAELPTEKNNMEMLAWMAIVFALSIYILPGLATLPSVPQMKLPAWFFGVGLLTYYFLSRQLSWSKSLLLFVAIVLKAIFDISHGDVTELVYTFVVILMVAITMKRFATVAIIGLFCLLLSFSYGYAKHFSRVILGGQESVHLYNFSPGGGVKNIVPTTLSIARRSAHSLVTDHVLARTPEIIPYDDRNPITDAAVNHLPRIIWPDKPLEQLGNAFGRAYEVLLDLDQETSWNVPWTADFFITGGYAWAFTCIFLIGIAIGLLNRFIRQFKDSAFRVGLFAGTTFPLFYQESNFSLMAGSIGWAFALPLIGYLVVSGLNKQFGKPV